MTVSCTAVGIIKNNSEIIELNNLSSSLNTHSEPRVCDVQEVRCIYENASDPEYIEVLGSPTHIYDHIIPSNYIYHRLNEIPFETYPLEEPIYEDMNKKSHSSTFPLGLESNRELLVYNVNTTHSERCGILSDYLGQDIGDSSDELDVTSCFPDISNEPLYDKIKRTRSLQCCKSLDSSDELDFDCVYDDCSNSFRAKSSVSSSLDYDDVDCNAVGLKRHQLNSVEDDSGEYIYDDIENVIVNRGMKVCSRHIDVPSSCRRRSLYTSINGRKEHIYESIDANQLRNKVSGFVSQTKRKVFGSSPLISPYS